ncbi:MAG TPA: hypothetical protein VF469_20620 [Kofleriaceae bacterium]
MLGTGFRVWFKNFIPFLVLTGMFHAPPWIWAISVAHGERTLENLHRAAQASLVANLLSWPISILVSAALAYGVVMELQGRRASIGASITTGLARFLPALGVWLLSLLCICLSTLALIIPGIIVSCMLYVATQASVLERPGVVGALKRSSELTRGHKMEIFGLVFVLGLLSLAFGLVLGLVTGVYSRPGGDIEAVFHRYAQMAYINLANHVITGSITATMTSVAYYFLRAEKEGTSAAELAAIFD